MPLQFLLGCRLCSWPSLNDSTPLGCSCPRISGKPPPKKQCWAVAMVQQLRVLADLPEDWG